MITKAVLLAAGRGSRLGVLTETQPKPLLVVAGRPIIVHILDGLRRAGIEEITVITGYLGDVLERELGNGEASSLSLRYVLQEKLDGTARAVALARDWLG
ncbi:MAG: sugar phosphate nucleotidyltransferase, partial [Anaerolineaceae bacterium]